MTAPGDVLSFIDTTGYVLGNFDWLVGFNGRQFRDRLKSVPKDERATLVAERKRAFTGNAPDVSKYFMATCAELGFKIPDDFFAAETRCTGVLVELEAIPDLERPGKLKVQAKRGTVAEPV